MLAEPLLPPSTPPRPRPRRTWLLGALLGTVGITIVWCGPPVARLLGDGPFGGGSFAAAAALSTAAAQSNTTRAPDRYILCTETSCDALPTVDCEPGAALVFTSQLFSDNSASFLQRLSVPLEADGDGDADRDSDLHIDVESLGDTHGLVGFGAAFTDAAADTWASASPGLRAQMVRQYFGPDGIGYAIGRVPIGGTDFSTAAYTYDDGSAGDLSLANFSLAMDEERKLPLLHAALELSPRLQLLATPWSAPAWMKDSGTLVWGSLIGEPGGPYYKAWASYICRFLTEYAERGVSVSWLTVQNEPWYSLVTRFSTRWNSMAFTAERIRDFVKRDLGPALAAHHLKAVKVVFHDDQRAQLMRVASVVMADPEAARYVSGAGFHWYDTMSFSWMGWGAIDALRYWEQVGQAAQTWPELTLIGTEAAEGFEGWARGPQLGSWWRLETYAYDMLRDLTHGAHGWMDWNLWLDSAGGPNWAENRCDAPLLLTAGGDAFVKQPTYYALAHFARFLPPGSRRLAVRAPAALDAVAYLTPQRRVASVLLNKDTAEHCLRLRDVRRGRGVRLCMPPRSLHTVVWDAGGGGDLEL